MTFLFSALLASTAFAQGLDLPAASPAASVSQAIGTVNVSVTYSSPGKKDREIWGGLVPFDEIWRTGANRATVLETDGDITVGGESIPAGSYAVFTIPGEKKWTVILNTNTDQGGTGSYDKKLDQARFTVEPGNGAERERMTFMFTDTTDKASSLDLIWAGTKVSLPIEVDSVGRANDAIDSYVKSSARQLANGARFRGEQGDPEGGLVLVEKSLSVEETWFATWVKAGLLKDTGDKKGAYKALKRAMELGERDGGFFYKSRVEKALDTWPKK